MEKLLTKKEIAESACVPVNTFNRWLRQGKIAPVDFDDAGNQLFAETQIEQAKALHKPEHCPKRKPAEFVDAPEKFSLFEDNASDTVVFETIDAPAEDTHFVAVDNDLPTLMFAEDSEGLQPARVDDTVVPTFDAPLADDDREVDSADLQSVANSSEETAVLMDADSKNENASQLVDVPDVESTIAICDPATIEVAPVVVDSATLGIEFNRQLKTLADYADFIRELSLKREQYDAAFTILIGRMLIEAKKLAGHGKWSNWLAENKYFGYSQQYANKFMRAAERWGNGKLKDVFQFNRSQLFELLSIPENEVDKFIETQSEAGKPVENQSRLEIHSAINEWKEAQIDTSAEKDIAVVDESKNAADNSQEPLEGVSDSATDTEYTPAEIDSEASFLFSRELSLTPADNDVEVIESVKKLPPIAHNGNGTVKWYTPKNIIEAAREVLGTIDLDPASDAEANQTVKAQEFYSIEDNGLVQEWRGRVWLNPPFTNGLIDKFVDKLLAEFGRGNVTEAIVLTDNATETRWFRKLADSSTAIVFTTGRINFRKGGTFEEGSPTRGQSFFYHGNNPDKFFRVFAKFGWACKVLASESSLEEEKSLFDN